MKKNNTKIKVKNKLPHLVEAVCEHPECPDWLKEGIWDLFSERAANVTYSRHWWAAQFEALVEDEHVTASKPRLGVVK